MWLLIIVEINSLIRWNHSPFANDLHIIALTSRFYLYSISNTVTQLHDIKQKKLLVSISQSHAQLGRSIYAVRRHDGHKCLHEWFCGTFIVIGSTKPNTIYSSWSHFASSIIRMGLAGRMPLFDNNWKCVESSSPSKHNSIIVWNSVCKSSFFCVPFSGGSTVKNDYSSPFQVSPSFDEHTASTNDNYDFISF